MRILLVIADPDAERYWDGVEVVESELRLPGMGGTDLAAAVRTVNPAQRIVMITDSVSVGRNVRRELGDISVLTLKRPRVSKAIKDVRSKRRNGNDDRGEGQELLDWVEAGLKATYNRTGKRRA